MFDLPPGEVTPVIETQGALEILKLVSAKPVPLDTVRDEIKIALTNGHLMIIMKDATEGVSAKMCRALVLDVEGTLLCGCGGVSRCGDSASAAAMWAPGCGRWA